MSLLRKVRILVGALVHKPFMPRPEKVELDPASGQPPSASPKDRLAPGTQAPEAQDGERVADLIARAAIDRLSMMAMAA